jgi:hypothetical protein
VSERDVRVWRHGRGISASWSSARVLARGMEHVWRALVVQWSDLVKGESERGPGLTAAGGALSCPWRALGRAHAVIGIAWAALGARCLTRVSFLSGHGGHRGLQ